MINRCEAFDESDLDVAIARFEELQPRTPNLDNAASRVGERFDACFAIRDWDRIAEMLTNDTYVDDRRRVVNSGPHYSRDTEIASIRAIAEVGVKDITATAIATRGERLALRRTRYSGRDRGPNAFHTDILDIVEIDANGLIAARIVFDADDIDAAFAELDARYVGGEAAAHAQAWSVLTRNALAFNQREPLITTQNWISIDHRRATAFEPGDMTPYIHATWDVAPDINLRIEAVHRLNDRGAVFNQALKGTSQEGFDAEWRDVIILTVDGENLARCEIFDEVDLDDALARFDELTRPATRLANAATRTRALLIESFNRRDLDTFCSALTPDGRYDDRRKGLRSEGSLKREFAPTMFSEAPAGWQWTDELVAIRGNRWVLCRDWFRDTDAPGRPVAVDDLSITEVTEDGLVCHSVIFDACDLTAAMAEVNARWIAFGEVSHPKVIDAAHCLAEATNRRDWEEILRLGADAAYVNHRQLSSPDIRTVADHMSSVEAMVSLAPDLWVEHSQILTHSAAGLVSEIALKGTSTDGFAIEIPLVMLALFDGERLTRFEVFDLEQGDLALSRFTELTDDPDD